MIASSGGIDSPVFNPRSVSLGQSQNNRIPYINNIDWMRPNPIMRAPHAPLPVSIGGGPVRYNGGPAKLTLDPADQPPPPNVLSSEAVRATGSGPYDSVYRQNLATYAGGQFVRPGGNLSFDPTGNLFGQTTGGGNAPVLGMPDSLASQALSGNPFKFTPPQPFAPPQDQLNNPLGWWKNQFMNNGGTLNRGRFMIDL